MTTAYPPALAQHLSSLSDAAAKLSVTNDNKYYSPYQNPPLNQGINFNKEQYQQHSSEKTLVAGMDDKRPNDYIVEKTAVQPDTRPATIPNDPAQYQWSEKLVDEQVPRAVSPQHRAASREDRLMEQTDLNRYQWADEGFDGSQAPAVLNDPPRHHPPSQVTEDEQRIATPATRLPTLDEVPLPLDPDQTLERSRSRDEPRQPKNEPLGVVANVVPATSSSSPNTTPSPPSRFPIFHEGPRPISSILSPAKYPSLPNGAAAPVSVPIPIAISSNSRVVAQHPTYITPPSSPTPIAVNPMYTYTTAPYSPDQTPATLGAMAPATPSRPPYPKQSYPQQYRTSGVPFAAQDGKEICMECAMRDQDMADIDVTTPGVWERESDVHYYDLCRREAEEEEQMGRVRTPSSSSDAHPILRSFDPNRPRAKGQLLTEENLKVWLQMNPREPQARAQTIDLYVKTQTALLEADALARARAQRESRALESRMKDTYDHFRRSTYDNGTQVADESAQGLRIKTSHSPRQSTSGASPAGPSPTPILSQITGEDRNGQGTAFPTLQHSRHRSRSREVTLLENGMIVEHVDVKKEERERRKEEKREREREKARERERSRARKSSRSSGMGGGAGDVMSMYSAHSPLPQADSGFYTSNASGGGGVDRPNSRYSVSQSSTRAMSVLTGPPGSGAGSAPAGANSNSNRLSQPLNNNGMVNGRMQSQVSLVDTQSLSSVSLNMNRRSRFFAFRNWSSTWRSQESFAPSAAGMSGSMMDMHLALENEKARLQVPSAVDIGSNAPSLRLGDQWPRRSQSTDRLNEGDKSTKKKKGLAKIWKIVTGSGGKNHHQQQSSSYGNDVNKSRVAQPGAGEIAQSEDDLPLAPPPPLSYLVNRTSARERSLSTSTSRRVSTNGLGGPVPAPLNMTSMSAALPTPTSIRNTWDEQGGIPLTPAAINGGNHILPVHAEESTGSYSNGGVMDPSFSSSTSSSAAARAVQPMQSEPDMRQRVDSPPVIVSSLSNGNPGPPSPRPASLYSIHKSLPPLPPTDLAISAYPIHPMTAPLEPPRPKTMYDLDPDAFVSPNPAFRRPEVRRQSFGGLASRPDANALHAFPTEGRFGERDHYGTGVAGNNASAHVSFPVYNELGASQRSLPRATDDKSSTKRRRSKFALSSLFGKLTTPSESRLSVVNPMSVPSGRDYDSYSSRRPSESDLNLDGSVTEYATTSRSRHATSGTGPASRMSVTSRKAIEELVEQDDEFVAYRYPSADQNLAILH